MAMKIVPHQPDSSHVCVFFFYGSYNPNTIQLIWGGKQILRFNLTTKTKKMAFFFFFVGGRINKDLALV